MTSRAEIFRARIEMPPARVALMKHISLSYPNVMRVSRRFSRLFDNEFDAIPRNSN